MARVRQLSTFAVVALVALRLGVGWHFFKEGAAKFQGPKFASAGMLGSAQGPLTERFRGLVWDADGRARLDGKKTEEIFDAYRRRVAAHYEFNAQQQKQASRAFEVRRRQLHEFFELFGSDVETYFKGLDRRDASRADAANSQVPSLRGQSQQVATELRKQSGPWLASIDALWQGYQSDLAALADTEQRRKGVLPIGKPGHRFGDTETIDRLIPYFILSIGILLMLGLLTRVAALGGVAFLLLVIASQWPGAPGAIPTYYQSVELLALLVLVATGAGRFAGLDFFIHCALGRARATKQGKKL